MEPRRLPWTVLVIGICLGAGCLAAPPSGGPPSATATPTPSATPTATPTVTNPPTTSPPVGTPTATVMGGGFEFSPDRATPIRLRNDWTRRVEIRVRVVAANGTVHDAAYVVRPNENPRQVYDLSAPASPGNVSFDVVMTARGTTSRATVDVTRCADVTGVITRDGNLSVRTAPC